MKVIPYLMFNGNCEEAFMLYARTLGGTLDSLMHFGQSPAATQVPADYQDKVMHVHLTLGNQALMGSDCPPGMPISPMQGCAVSLNVDSVAEAERVFAGLSAGGEVRMPLEKTFWAERFGMFSDRYGVSWMVNCEKDQ